MLTVNRQLPEKTAPGGWLGPAPWIEVPPPGAMALQAMVEDRTPRWRSDAAAPLVILRAQGSVVEDVDHNRFLDFTSGGGACPAGHCHPRVVAAIEAQSRRLLYMCGRVRHETPSRLTRELARIAPGPRGKRVVLLDGRPQAVELAFELARRRTGRPGILAIGGAVQVRTPDVPADEAGVLHLAYGDIEVIARALREAAAPLELAAVFIEPLDCDGGCASVPRGYVPAVQQFCRDHGLLLICDESRSGMGRTGRLLACEHEAVVPDMLVLGRNLASGPPIGALVADEDVLGGSVVDLPSPACADPVSCAAALASLEVVEGQLAPAAGKLGPTLFEKLGSTAASYPCISPPRGLGLLATVDVAQQDAAAAPGAPLRDRIVDEAFKMGLILQPCGVSQIQFAPALCINQVQLEVGLNTFEEAIATAAE